MKSNSKVQITSIFVFALALIVGQVGAGFVGNLSNVQFVKADSGITIVVPDDYPTIGNAVGNASTSDTILVKKGVYRENVLVDKSLSLKGQGNNQTVVIGTGGLERGANPVFRLAANNVKLSGFTLKSLNYTSATLFASGVIVEGDNCTITGNMMSDTYYGIFSSILSSAIISNNSIDGARKDGIRLCGGSLNTVSGNLISKSAQSSITIDGYLDIIANNTISNDTRGIGLGASYSVLFGNNITGSSESGFYVASSNSIVASNYVSDSKYSVYFTSFFALPNNNLFYKNDFVNCAQPVGASLVYNVQHWDNGKEGNYWSSYNGTDSNNDGIGDTAYEVYVNNTDHYPLMAPVNLPATNSALPALPTPPATVNGTAAIWHFDEVELNGATPDAIGDNHAVLEPTSSGNGFSPVLADGISGKALKFNGSDYVFVTSSSSLQLQGEITIDTWINIGEFKNLTYNNIMVECARTLDKYPTRIMGFSVNGESSQETGNIPLGALRGYFVDNTGTFNEIVTTDPVVSLHEWTHVVFTRSFATGMHIYVNGEEKNVNVTSGVQNPSGSIKGGSEFYMGHDAILTIDEVSVSTFATSPISSSPSTSVSPSATEQPTTSPITQAFTCPPEATYAIAAVVTIAIIITVAILLNKRKK
jgi:parallel beta-helix repeat protein